VANPCHFVLTLVMGALEDELRVTIIFGGTAISIYGTANLRCVLSEFLSRNLHHTWISPITISCMTVELIALLVAQKLRVVSVLCAGFRLYQRFAPRLFRTRPGQRALYCYKYNSKEQCCADQYRTVTYCTVHLPLL
jgi:hypothetical protein